MSRPIGVVIGVVFLAAWVITQYFGPLGTTHALSFPVFFVLIALEIVAFSLLSWWRSNAEGRRAVNAAWWLLFLALASYLLSHYGAYGVFKKPPIPFPYDNLIELLIGITTYYWAVRSGFATAEIRAIAESGTGLVPEEDDTLEQPRGPSERPRRRRVVRGPTSAEHPSAEHDALAT
jgi:hypothetical protein